jgi:medium-chain acyl-[acyl-carrier-protein] hydrolase
MVNLRGQAGLYTILNLIQDVGFQQAIHWGIRLPVGKGWVFTRQKLTMVEWPKWNENVTLRTWLRPPEGAFILRDYEILVGDKKVGECTSAFTVMDMNTRKLVGFDWDPYLALCRGEDFLSLQPQKLQLEGDLETLVEIIVRNSDIDMNNHVNNTKYAQWILDSIPIEVLRGGVELKEYEVNFLAEAKIGDLICIKKVKQDKIEASGKVIQFQGLRSASAKPCFTVQMRTQDT